MIAPLWGLHTRRDPSSSGRGQDRKKPQRSFTLQAAQASGEGGPLSEVSELNLSNNDLDNVELLSDECRELRHSTCKDSIAVIAAETA